MKHLLLSCLILWGLIVVGSADPDEKPDPISWDASEKLDIDAYGGPEMDVISNLKSLIQEDHGILRYDVEAELDSHGVYTLVLDSHATLTIDDGGTIYTEGYKMSDTFTLPEVHQIFMDHIYNIEYDLNNLDVPEKPTAECTLILLIPDLGIDKIELARNQDDIEAELDLLREKYEKSEFVYRGATHTTEIELEQSQSRNGVTCTWGRSMEMTIGGQT